MTVEPRDGAVYKIHYPGEMPGQAVIAQLAEQVLCKHPVPGSNPGGGLDIHLFACRTIRDIHSYVIFLLTS